MLDAAASWLPDPAAETAIGANGRHRRKLKVGVDLPTTAEFKAMLAATAGPKDRALLCLAGIAGLRASEIRGLPWLDLNLTTEPSVTITRRADKWGTPSGARSRNRRSAGSRSAR